MNRETYLSQLTAQLHCRGVDEDRIGEIIKEVENHLQEGGEDPENAFGPAEHYAEKMAVFTENHKHSQSPGQWHKRTFRATALDEMEILRWAGREGWELVNVGALALFCRRPVNLSGAFHWDYVRRTGVQARSIGEEMAAGGWKPCGNWIVFHYFKRKIGVLDSPDNQRGQGFGQEKE